MNSGGSVPSIKVLYVDDEPVLLEICKIFLENYEEFKVDTLPSATEALKCLETGHYDAIISDYQMPMMDGLQFLKELKSRGDNTPFIIFTGRGREEVAIDALNSGADFYIQKGGDPKSQFVELSHKIKQAVRRQNAEAALAESREYLDNIFNSVKAGILVIDEESHEIIDINPAAADLIGVAREDIIGKTCHKHICPNEAGRCPITDLGHNVDNSERVLITCDGREIPVIKYVTRLVLSGRPCLLETFIDNTERKAAEDELYEKEDLYHQFFKIARESLFITTAEGQWVDFNNALVEACGYESREDVFKSSVSSFYANPEERDEFLKSVEQEGIIRDRLMKFRKKDGTVFDGLITIVPQRRNDGSLKGFIGTVRMVV